MPRTQQVAKLTILALRLGRRLRFFDLAAQPDVLVFISALVGLQFLDERVLARDFVVAGGADLVARLAAHKCANAFGGGALLQHLLRNWGRLRRGLPRGLLAALAVGPGLDVGNFPTSLLLRSDRCDRLV